MFCQAQRASIAWQARNPARLIVTERAVASAFQRSVEFATLLRHGARGACGARQGDERRNAGCPGPFPRFIRGRF